jgi:hypothetical protein
MLIEISFFHSIFTPFSRANVRQLLFFDRPDGLQLARMAGSQAATGRNEDASSHQYH